jgi:hypothetical protein
MGEAAPHDPLAPLAAGAALSVIDRSTGASNGFWHLWSSPWRAAAAEEPSGSTSPSRRAPNSPSHALWPEPRRSTGAGTRSSSPAPTPRGDATPPCSIGRRAPPRRRWSRRCCTRSLLTSRARACGHRHQRRRRRLRSRPRRRPELRAGGVRRARRGWRWGAAAPVASTASSRRCGGTCLDDLLVMERSA